MQRIVEKIFKYKVHILILVGILIRALFYTYVPGGNNQDECMAGYEAWNILMTGHDSWGHYMPMYLVSLGSGMNALNSYLMIPFIALFGLKIWVIRLPQLIVACLSLPVLYKLVKLLFNERAAFFALLVFVTAPWHIMLSRWGVESNLAPGFILFGLYFGCKAYTDDNNQKYLIISSVCYGLTLYTYALTWVLLPMVLAGQFIYLFLKKRIRFNVYLVGFVLILGCAAIPCILFILVNKEIIEPIYTHVLSVPKMLVMRSGEFANSFDSIKENFLNFYSIVISQSDGSFINSDIYNYGMFYKFALPVWMVGFISLISGMVIKIRNREEFLGEFTVALYTIASFILCILVKVNIVRSNYMWIPVVITIGYGCYMIATITPIKKLKNSSVAGLLVLAIYLVSLISFEKYYYGTYSNILQTAYADGVGEAMEHVMNNKDGSEILYFDSAILYPVILFYLKQNPDVFRETVIYDEYPAAWVYAKEWDGVKRTDIVDPESEGIYVVRSELITDEIKSSFEYVDFGRYGVVRVN